MPCGFHISQDDDLVLITASQTIDLDDAQSTFVAVLAHPDFEAHMPQLVDLRGIEVSADLLDDGVRQDYEPLAHFLIREYRPKIDACVSIVVDDDLGTEATAAIFHLSCQLPDTELFDSYEQALRWLIHQEFGNPIRTPTPPQ